MNSLADLGVPIVALGMVLKWVVLPMISTWKQRNGSHATMEQQILGMLMAKDEYHRFLIYGDKTREAVDKLREAVEALTKELRRGRV